MEDTFVIESLVSAFESEIANKFEFVNNEIIVVLKDGTKARVKTKNVA